MKAYIYQIEAISNLHAGSGEANEGVIDNLIQRDSVTGLPIINASSLKGALREHFKDQDKELIKHIFGSEVNDPTERKVGAYRFFDARLLAIPVRSNKTPYLMATSPLVVQDYLRTLELFGLPVDKELKQLAQQTPGSPWVTNLKYNQARIEDLEKTAACKDPLKGLSAWFGNAGVLLSDTDFKTLCDNDHLPVFARNLLNDGQSENLWYEQVLPRFSQLYFTVLVPNEDTWFSQFNAHIIQNLVQIGANATVGYGYCKLTNILDSNFSKQPQK